MRLFDSNPRSGWKKMLIGVMAAGLLAVACGTDAGGALPTSTATSIPPTVMLPTLTSAPNTPTPTSVGKTVTEPIDLTKLPLGDGKVSSSPQKGYVWACQTNFLGGGAEHAGDWIRDDGTWDSTGKVTVDGEVEWPSSLSITLDGNERVISSNDLPDHATGNYPISPGDDAYQYDRNPNSIQSQDFEVRIPANPQLAATPSCVPQGPIGILLTGSVIFNALDAAGRDAVAHEVQDACQGHPESNGTYHYHDLTSCLDDDTPGEHSQLVGYALDGIGIFGHLGENDEELTDADLDACHGHTHLIEWNGQIVEMYHYHATYEYPYTVGCYLGTPVRLPNSGGPPSRP